MTYKPDWDIDRMQGESAEQLVDRTRTSILAGTVEVKYDREAPRTGNVYVEYQCRWRDGQWHPSGIAVTRAEAWAFVLAHTLIVIPTEVLAAIARDEWNSGRREMVAGSHPTRGVVIPIETLVTKSIALATRVNLTEAA